MNSTRRFVLWSAALLSTVCSVSAQLTLAQHGVMPSRPGFTSNSLSDRPASVFDETRNRILLPVYVPQNAVFPGSRIVWEFDGQSWFGPAVQDLPLEEAAVADDPRPGRKVMFSVSGTRIWDPFTRHWDLMTTVASPAPDAQVTMALLPGVGTVLLHPNGQTWIWNGLAWNQLVTAHSPTPRGRAAMTRDVVGNRLLLVGGQPATSAEAWLFDGTDWTQTISLPYGPPFFWLYNQGIATDVVRNQVVVFGGRAGLPGYIAFTWLWNGASWSQPTPAHNPPAGEVKGMSWDSATQRVLLFVDAGSLNGGPITSWAWDGTDWTQLLPNGRGTVVTPQARSSPVLAYSTVTHKTVLFGGYNLLSSRNDTWESAGRVWQQRTPPSGPPATELQAAALLRSTGDLYYYPGRTPFTTYNEQWNWGGQQWSGLTLSAPPLAPLVWQVVGSLQSSLYGWVFVRLVTSGTPPNMSNTVQLIQPFSGSTAAVAVPGGPAPRTGSVMVQSPSPAIASNKVWLFGGQNAAGADQNDVWELADTGIGGNLAWTQLVPTSGPVPPPRSGAAVAHDGGTHLYVMGGYGTPGNFGDTWTFDLVSRQWTQVPGPGPSARNGAAMTRDVSIARMVLTGGFDGSLLGDIWECDGSAWTQRATPATPPSRNNASLVYDRLNHRSVLFGGSTGQAVNDTWSYDGSVWTPFVGKGPQPVNRLTHATCFDEFWNAMVVFGGWDGNGVLGDTWRLSASQTWSPGPAGPAGRANAAMTYAVLQGIPCSIMVGGFTASGQIGDTWRYDVGTSSWLQLPGGLPARDIHAIAWDRMRNVVVLFGGRDVGDGFLDDTWELNLATAAWSQRTPAHHPSGRWNHAMHYDAGRARTVVVGGYGPSGYLNDVWDWDGTDWLQRAPETAPAGPREDAAIAYDSDHGKLLMFGGWNGANVLGDLTELGARIDVAGPGNTAHPEGLRFYSQPALGQPLQLGFANSVLGLYAIDFGPVQQPLGPLPVPLVCEAANLYAAAVFYVVPGTNEPNIAWIVPNTPVILGLSLVFQAFSAQPASCWRATDALQVRF